MTRNLSQLRANVSVARPQPKKRRLGTRQIVILLLVLTGSLAAGYFGYQQFGTTKAPAVQQTTNPVRRGNIAATVNIMGSTAAMSQAKLTFETTGKLTQLLVKAGDNVKQGDVLAKVDTADLELQVAQAKVSLDQAKLKLSDLKAGPKPDDVTAAESAVRDAEVALVNARDNQTLTSKSTAVAKDLRDRQNEFNWYQSHYGDLLNKNASQAELDIAYAAMMVAQERLDTARVSADLAVRKAENDILKAEDSLRLAKSKLATLKTGTAATDIAAQDVAVSQAEATFKQKQLLLQKASLVAPFDGIIDSVSVNVGEQVSTSAAAMVIVNMDRYRIDARVDETDVGKLVSGQTASVTIDALTNANLKAKVISIAANPVVSQGVVNYPVVLELEPSSAAVRPGMTANLAVEVAKRENVLLVPNRAVRTQGRNSVVDVMVNGKSESRPVTVGMSNDQFTEVTNGLQEGDTVVIPSTTTSGSRVPQGGMGGLPGGVMVPAR